MSSAREALRAANQRNRNTNSPRNTTTNLIDEISNIKSIEEKPDGRVANAETDNAVHKDSEIQSHDNTVQPTNMQNAMPNAIQDAPRNVSAPVSQPASQVPSQDAMHYVSHTEVQSNPTVVESRIMQGINICAPAKRIKSKAVSVRLYSDVYDQLNYLAKKNDSSINDLINQILSQVFNLG